MVCMYMRDGVDKDELEKITEQVLHEKSLTQFIHGDDNWLIGKRETLRTCFNDELSKEFVCRMKALISLREDDDREGELLRRKIRVTPQGWGYEADEKHARSLLDRYGLSKEGTHGAATPGISKSYEDVVFEDEAQRGLYDPPLQGREVREHRGGVGTAGFLAGDRTDVKYSVKEIQRDGAKPRRSTVQKMKRLARYIQRVPRYVNVYRWQRVKRGVRRKLQGAVDADHAGCKRTRKSTHCVILRIGGHVLTDFSATQAGLPALSRGEPE